MQTTILLFDTTWMNAFQLVVQQFCVFFCLQTNPTHICCTSAGFDVWTFFAKEFVENTLRNLDIGILTWPMHPNAIFGEIPPSFCHFFALVFASLDLHCFVCCRSWYRRCLCEVSDEFFNIFTDWLCVCVCVCVCGVCGGCVCDEYGFHSLNASNMQRAHKHLQKYGCGTSVPSPSCPPSKQVHYMHTRHITHTTHTKANQWRNQRTHSKLCKDLFNLSTCSQQNSEDQDWQKPK